MASVQNLSSGTLAANITSSSTTLYVYVGSGTATVIKAVWPTPPFYATIMPQEPSNGTANSLNSEIVKVTAIGTSGNNVTLTVTRGQRGTTARAFNIGAIVTNGIYMDDIFDKIYPVGTIYETTAFSTVAQVQNAFGGTWQTWGMGRVSVCVNPSDASFNTVEKTGGEKNHTLAISEMPSHQHKLSLANYGSDVASGVVWSSQQVGKYAYSSDMIEPVGGGGAHNNLQPYITSYKYKRIA